MFIVIVVSLCVLGACAGMKSEHTCSRFHYEEKTLEKIIRLQIYVEQMKEDMDNTQKNVVDKLVEVKNQRTKMNTEFGGMKSTFASELAAMKQLITDTLSSIERESNQMKTTIADETASMKQLITDTLASYEEDVKKMKDTLVAPPVAFSSKTPLKSSSMSDGKVLVFTTVMLNYNKAYDKNTGIFTAPMAGIYQFTAQLCTYANQASYYGIYKNEDAQTSSRIADSDWHICSTLTALIDVQVSDRISVRCKSSCSGDTLYDNDNHQNILSGFLVQTPI